MRLKLSQGKAVVGRGELGTDPCGRSGDAVLVLDQDQMDRSDPICPYLFEHAARLAETEMRQE